MEKSSDLHFHGQVLLTLVDSMTIINPHLEGKTRTGTLPLTSEVWLSLWLSVYSHWFTAGWRLIAARH